MFQRYLDFTNRITDRLFNNWLESFDGVGGGYILSVVNVLIILLFIALVLGSFFAIFILPTIFYNKLIDGKASRIALIKKEMFLIRQNTECVGKRERKTSELQDELAFTEKKLKKGVILYLMMIFVIYIPLTIPLFLIGLDIVSNIGPIAVFFVSCLILALIAYFASAMIYCYRSKTICPVYKENSESTLIEILKEKPLFDLTVFFGTTVALGLFLIWIFTPIVTNL